ncbi:Ig-like domain-containing protein [Brevibacillus ginsengisoli]|uniref:Ig-like domain-containing protein n=1 Tax=Brevibacillus ginsengisoli TaxID=363854 RepID=UPI003CF29A67
MKKITRLLLVLTLLLGVGLNTTAVQAVTSESTDASFAANSFAVMYTNPIVESTSVPINIQPAVTFLYPIEWVNGSSGVTLRKVGEKDTVAGTASIKNNTITFKPTRNLSSSSNYILEIQEKSVQRTEDASQQNTYYSYIFKTGTSEGPIITNVTPYEMQMGVSSKQSIKITFDRTIKEGKGSISLMDVNNHKITGKTTISNSTITFQPKSPLTKKTIFYLMVPDGLVKDSKGKTNVVYASIFQTDNSGPDISEPNRYSVLEDQSIKLSLSGGKTPYKAVSSNTRIATVKMNSKTLEIKGLREGTVTITITDGKKNEVKINVEVKSNKIEF